MNKKYRRRSIQSLQLRRKQSDFSQRRDRQWDSSTLGARWKRHTAKENAVGGKTTVDGGERAKREICEGE